MSKIAGVGNSSNIFSGQRRDFIVMRKDTFEYTGQIDYVDEDGTDATYDFTSCIGSMAIKKKKNDTTAVRIVSVTFDGVEYTLNVDAENMDMDAGKYYYDLQIYDTDSKMITKMYGDFIVLQDITDFLHPHDEEIYLTLEAIVGYEQMEVFRDILLIKSNTDYREGLAQRQNQSVGSEVGYSIQPKDSMSTMISSSVAHQLMTYWFKDTASISSVAAYLATLSLNSYSSISSEIKWIVLAID